MMRILPAQNRHFTDMGWLKTYWLFSFGNYYDPNNLRHGSLRVFNDDIVAAQSGFPTHPHEEMEIVSLVLDGEMEHRDTMGNTAIIRTNDVQRMTAGTGLQHSEWNRSQAAVHFFQIWIAPDRAGLAPSYDQKTFAPRQWQNRLALLASNRLGGGWVSLNTDASVYRAALDAGASLSYETAMARNLFLYVVTGNGMINGEKISSHDQARISDTRGITLETAEGIDFVLVDISE